MAMQNLPISSREMSVENGSSDDIKRNKWKSNFIPSRRSRSTVNCAMQRLWIGILRKQSELNRFHDRITTQNSVSRGLGEKAEWMLWNSGESVGNREVGG
jgi:hypothetical protein